MSIPISQFIPPSSIPPWCPYICSLCLCLYFCFANKMIYTIFSRFHIYALICDTCFSLSDLLQLHSVWQSLGPSMSAQMTQFCAFLWLSNILLYIGITFFFIHSSVDGHLGCSKLFSLRTSSWPTKSGIWSSAYVPEQPLYLSWYGSQRTVTEHFVYLLIQCSKFHKDWPLFYS